MGQTPEVLILPGKRRSIIDIIPLLRLRNLVTIPVTGVNIGNLSCSRFLDYWDYCETYTILVLKSTFFAQFHRLSDSFSENKKIMAVQAETQAFSALNAGYRMKPATRRARQVIFLFLSAEILSWRPKFNWPSFKGATG
jgi:hypothetical protein